MAIKHKVNVKESNKTTNWHRVFLVLVFVTVFVYLLSILLPSFVSVKTSTQKQVSLYLLTNAEEFSVNDLIGVDVYLDTKNKKSAGVDAVLRYDPSYLEVSPLKRNELTGAVIKGNASLDTRQNRGEVQLNPHNYLDTQTSTFDIFPYMKADTLNGIIYFSALAKPLVDVEGQVLIASLIFKAKHKGNTKIDIVFEKGTNTDSNVAYLGEDILEEVHGADIFIQ